jgi:hypothetical protein
MYLLLFATTVTLTACGSNGDGQSGSAGDPDAFTAFVRTLVASSPEDTEPQVIDAVVVTSPEVSIPQAL